MNWALIAIGLRSPGLRRAALAAARRIGRLHVDRGETTCVTLDAAAYIRRVAERAGRRSATAGRRRTHGRPSRSPRARGAP